MPSCPDIVPSERLAKPPRVEKSIQIQVNGEDRALPSGMTVGELLRELQIGPERVAVELNLQILDRADFEGRRLQDGDRVEILSFIGGGARGTW